MKEWLMEYFWRRSLFIFNF